MAIHDQKWLILRLAVSLLAGFLFWSSWATPSQAEKDWRAEKARYDLARRAGDLMADPGRMTPRDLKAVESAWGADYSRMLALLKP